MRTRFFYLSIIGAACAAGWCGMRTAPAQEAQSAREVPPHELSAYEELLEFAQAHHGWSRLSPGAWRKVHVLQLTFDESGQVTGRTVAVKLERLVAVEGNTFTLAQEMQVEVDGQQVEPEPAETVFGILTGEPGAVRSIVRREPEILTVDNEEVESSVYEVIAQGEAHSVRTRLWYSPTVAPYVLKSISQADSLDSHETAWRRTRRTLAAHLPFQLQGDQPVDATFLEERQVSSKLTRHSILVTVPDVPGGIAARWTKEMNAEGRLVRKEIESLVGWGVAPEASSEPTPPPQPDSRG